MADALSWQDDHRVVRIGIPDDGTSHVMKRPEVLRPPAMIASALRQRHQTHGDGMDLRAWYIRQTNRDTGLHHALDNTAVIPPGDGRLSYELCRKPVHDINMTRSHGGSFGFTMEQHATGVRVASVEPNGVAVTHGLTVVRVCACALCLCVRVRVCVYRQMWYVFL